MIPIIVQIDLTLEESSLNSLSEFNLAQATSPLPPKIRVSIPSDINTRTGLPKHRLEALRKAVLKAYSGRTNGRRGTIGRPYSYSSSVLRCLTEGHDFRYFVSCRETDTLEKNGEYEVCMRCWKVIPA